MLEAAPEAVARALRENPKEAALVIGLHPAVLHACATEQPEAIASCLGSLPAQLLPARCFAAAVLPLTHSDSMRPAHCSTMRIVAQPDHDTSDTRDTRGHQRYPGYPRGYPRGGDLLSFACGQHGHARDETC